MTNPFAAAAPAAAAPADDEKKAAPATTVKTAEPADTAGGAVGIGDPFATPVGIGDGRITDYVGNLLLLKPTEYVPEMNTSQGKTDAVRADIAVLDDENEPGQIVTGVLLFQQALKREARNILDGPLPYLLGRLHKGKTNGGNTLYTFETPTEEDVELARKFIAVKTL